MPRYLPKVKLTNAFYKKSLLENKYLREDDEVYFIKYQGFGTEVLIRNNDPECESKILNTSTEIEFDCIDYKEKYLNLLEETEELRKELKKLKK